VEKISSRELKTRLSHYLRLVRMGHSIQVTERGEVVAELLPPAHAMPKGDTQTRLAEMARRGLVRLGAPNDRRVYKLLPRLTPPGTAKRLLDEERGKC
jgi:prevent-host-death family protein